MIRPISIPPPVPEASALGRARLALVSLAPAASSELARDDWAVLFRAVMSRLSRISAEPGCEPIAQPLPDSARRLRSEVRECVNALRQLHASTCDVSGRDLRFRRAYRDLRWSLAWPRIDTEAAMPHAD